MLWHEPTLHGRVSAVGSSIVAFGLVCARLPDEQHLLCFRYNQHTQIVEYLLLRGADAPAIMNESHGVRVLWLACAPTGDSVSLVVAVLLQSTGYTPLHYAATTGMFEVAQLLCNAHCDVEAKVGTAALLLILVKLLLMTGEFGRPDRL